MKPTLNEQVSKYREAMINFGRAIGEATRVNRLFNTALNTLSFQPGGLVALDEGFNYNHVTVSGEISFDSQTQAIPSHLLKAIKENRIGKFVVPRLLPMNRDFPRMFHNNFLIELQFMRSEDFGDGKACIGYSPLFETFSGIYDSIHCFANNYENIDLPEYEIFIEGGNLKAHHINQPIKLNSEGRKPRVCKR